MFARMFIRPHQCRGTGFSREEAGAADKSLLSAKQPSRLKPVPRHLNRSLQQVLWHQTANRRNSRSHELITRLKFSCSARLTAT